MVQYLVSLSLSETGGRIIVMLACEQFGTPAFRSSSRDPERINDEY